MRREAWFAWFIGAVVVVFGVAIAMQYRSIFSPTQTTPELTNTAPLTRPTIKITDPQRGRANAPITIVYFTDFGCESCSQVWPTVQALEKDPAFKDNIRFVWKDFPAHRNTFPESYTLHKAARCAAAQGRFWEFQAASFARITAIRLRARVLPDVIVESGVNPSTLQTCIDAGVTTAAVEDNYEEGRRLGLTGTPTFFINDKRFDGLLPYAMLAGHIRNALAKSDYETK